MSAMRPTNQTSSTATGCDGQREQRLRPVSRYCSSDHRCGHFAGIDAAPPFGQVFFRNYLNDLLLIPCALPLVLQLQSLLGLRLTDAFPSPFEVGLHLTIWSLYCEWIGPIVQQKGIGDPLDVVAYCMGGGVSLVIWTFMSGRKRIAPSVTT
jgi:hypothetical protein